MYFGNDVQRAKSSSSETLCSFIPCFTESLATARENFAVQSVSDVTFHSQGYKNKYDQWMIDLFVQEFQFYSAMIMKFLQIFGQDIAIPHGQACWSRACTVLRYCPIINCFELFYSSREPCSCISSSFYSILLNCIATLHKL